MAGELATIISTNDPVERLERTNLLQHVALWKLRANATWSQVRSTYAHVIRKIENQEIGWDTEWERYERHIYDRMSPANRSDRSNKSTRSTQSKETVWYCKPFQRMDGCNREAPHSAKVFGVVRQVQHICATCLFKLKELKYHSESSPECPYKST